MTVKMTGRDKKLLMGLGIFCLITGLVFLLILPLLSGNSDRKLEIEENEQKIAEMDAKLEELLVVRAENKTIKEQLVKQQERLYPMLESQQIDKILTEKAVFSGLSVQRLSIAMPTAPASLTDFRSGENSGSSNPNGVDAVWIASVQMTVNGSMEIVDWFIDELSTRMPGIRLMGFRYTEGQMGTGSLRDGASLDLEVWMCRKEEE